jgi:hypothetical protein
MGKLEGNDGSVFFNLCDKMTRIKARCDQGFSIAKLKSINSEAKRILALLEKVTNLLSIKIRLKSLSVAKIKALRFAVNRYFQQISFRRRM